MLATFFAHIFYTLLVSTTAQWQPRSVEEALLPLPRLDIQADGPQWTPATSLEGQQVGNEENTTALLNKLTQHLGLDLLRDAQRDLDDLEAAIEPIFIVVPRNEYGKLGHTAVRYVLHRLFVSRHGWFIRGLDPHGAHFNSSSPLEVFHDKLPAHVQGLFERRLGGSGFDLQEIALFAAVLENLIHKEAVEKIKVVYWMYGIAVEDELAEQEVGFVVDTYMSAYILSIELSKENSDHVKRSVSNTGNSYLQWPETQNFVRRILHEVSIDGSITHWHFDDVVRLVLEIGERYGRWQNKECQVMKHKLMNLEGAEPGCIPMANFYRGFYTTGSWEFGESPEQLRDLGALDDSEPSNIKVMVPNYLNSLTNCVASSSYYSVCCIDECEELLGHIEHRVRTPDASVDEILAIVSELPSSTVPENHEIPRAQRIQLNRIAWQHDGRVPLHGRLFMQWLHAVFPRECQYPHKSGTTRKRESQAWSPRNGLDSNASKAQMMAFIENTSSDRRPSEKDGQCGKWQDDEEYFVPRHTHLPHLRHLETDAYTWAAASCVALICALAATVVMIVSLSKGIKATAKKALAVEEERKSRLMLV